MIDDRTANGVDSIICREFYLRWWLLPPLLHGAGILSEYGSAEQSLLSLGACGVLRR